MDEQGFPMSYRTVYRSLKEAKITLKKAQKWTESKDPKFYDKKRIDELRAKRPRKGKVVSFDEKGTIAVKHYGGKMYAEKAPKVEAKQNVRGVFEMLCAYDIHTHEVMYEFYHHKSHVEVADILTKLKQRNKHYRLYVILLVCSHH